MGSFSSYDPFSAELRRFADQLDRRTFRAVHSGFGYADVRKKNLNPLPNLENPSYLDTSKVLNYPKPAEAHESFGQTFFSESTVAFPEPMPASSLESLEKLLRRPEKEKIPTDFFRSESDQPQLPSSILNDFVRTHLSAERRSWIKLFRFPKISLPLGFLGVYANRFFRLLLAHAIDLSVVVMTFGVSVIAAAWFLAPRPDGVRFAAAKEFILQWEPITMLLKLSVMDATILVYVLFVMYWVLMRAVVGKTLGSHI